MALVLAHNSVLSDWLSFFSSLFWPLVSLVAVILFKDQIRDLINRVKRVKVGGIETEFEQPVDESVIERAAIPTDVPDIEPPLPEAPVGLDMIGLLAPGGWLTERGVDQVIRQSGFLKPNEEVLAHLLLLKTTKQRTWLVATSDWIFCLLDDERTREGGRVIQWRQPRDAARHTSTKPSPEYPNLGRVNIGEKRNWLYSRSLHPEADELIRNIEALAG